LKPPAAADPIADVEVHESVKKLKVKGVSEAGNSKGHITTQCYKENFGVNLRYAKI